MRLIKFKNKNKKKATKKTLAHIVSDIYNTKYTQRHTHNMVSYSVFHLKIDIEDVVYFIHVSH